MPFINTKTNVEISKDAEVKIKSRLGKAVSTLGKSEGYLMVNFEDRQRLYFGGDASPAAFVEVRLFGKASRSAYAKMTEAVTAIVSEEAKVPADRIYVQYEEVPNWGLGGSNF